MKAASVWRGGDSHRSGPVVIPAQQISDLPAERQAGDKGHAHHGRTEHLRRSVSAFSRGCIYQRASPSNSWELNEGDIGSPS